MVVIREAAPRDFDRMGEIHVAAWREAYRGVMSADFLSRLDPARSAAGFVQATATDGTTVLVAETDVVDGWCTIGKPEDGVPGTWGRLIAINMAPQSFGSGAAQSLIERAESLLRDSGYRAVYLWVERGNARARRFYERNGWRADGTEQTESFGGADVSEVRYVKALA